MLKEMIRILENPSTLKQEIHSNHYDMGLLKGEDPYYEFFYISSHFVLQRKQKSLDQGSKVKKLYAVDYYGLYSINKALGPNKLKHFFKNEA
jgi:hypothetical protein